MRNCESAGFRSSNPVSSSSMIAGVWYGSPTIMEASTLMPCARNSRKSSSTWGACSIRFFSGTLACRHDITYADLALSDPLPAQARKQEVAMQSLRIVAVLVSFFPQLAVMAQTDCDSPERRVSVTAREIAAGNDGSFRYSADAAGGMPPYTYSWSGAVGSNTFTSSDRQTPIFQPFSDRYADGTAADRTGCTAQATIGS